MLFAGPITALSNAAASMANGASIWSPAACDFGGPPLPPPTGAMQTSHRTSSAMSPPPMGAVGLGGVVSMATSAHHPSHPSHPAHYSLPQNSNTPPAPGYPPPSAYTTGKSAYRQRLYLKKIEEVDKKLKCTKIKNRLAVLHTVYLKNVITDFDYDCSYQLCPPELLKNLVTYHNRSLP